MSPPSSISGSEGHGPRSKSSGSSIFRESILDHMPVLLKRSSSVYSRDTAHTQFQQSGLVPEPLKVTGKGKETELMKSAKGTVEYETIEGTALAGNLLVLA